MQKITKEWEKGLSPGRNAQAGSSACGDGGSLKPKSADLDSGDFLTDTKIM